MRQSCIGILSVSMVLALLGCAGEQFHREGLNQIADGKSEEGLRNLAKAVEAAPQNVVFKQDLLGRRDEHINRLLMAAGVERAAGQWDAALASYQRVLAIDPNNLRAAEGNEATRRDRRYGALLAKGAEILKAGDAARALDLVKQVLTESPGNRDAIALRRQIEDQMVKSNAAGPQLTINRRKPVTLEFRDASLRIVLDALARSSGINFILDKDVNPDLRTTINLRQAPLEDAIELLLQTNRLEKKVLNGTSLLLYSNTPEKQKEHQELIVKGFYLSNADVKQTQLMLKNMLKAKDIFIDEKLNLLMMRDTPDAIRLAEKLIAMQDLYEPELMLEVEVLEVKRSRLMELGVKLPNQMTFTPIAANPIATLNDLKGLSSDRLATVLPSATLNLRSEIGDAKILANPRIRARNREKAKIMIGDKVPVVSITTTSNGVSSESVQYLDVGIKLEVESNVYLQDEAAIKIGLEVSSLVREVRTPQGSLAYQIGSRSASTVLRLKDGETQVLAGLISDEDRTTASRLPGIGDIPMLGRLFSSQKDEREKTEIVLSITPRLIRNINRPDPMSSEFWSGTEMNLKAKSLEIESRQTAETETAAPADNVDTAVAGSAAPTAVSLKWDGPSKVKVGDQFKVALRLKADGGVRSLPFQMAYDPAVFQVVEVAEGPFFKQREAKTSISSNVDAGAGKVFVSVVRSGVDGAVGDDVVATVTMRALAAKSQSDIRLLMSAPVSMGEKAIVPAPPAPFVINVN